GRRQGLLVEDQRMAAAGFTEALENAAAVGGEKQQTWLQAAVRKLLQLLGQTAQFRTARTRIDAQRHPCIQLGVVADLFEEARRQGGRQVVHAVEPEIFQGMQGGALAAAGKAADLQQLLHVRSV